MYEDARHFPDDIVVDPVSGTVYHRYDNDCLFDPTTDIYYEPFSSSPSEKHGWRVLGGMMGPVQ